MARYKKHNVTRNQRTVGVSYELRQSNIAIAYHDSKLRPGWRKAINDILNLPSPPYGCTT